MTDVIKLVVGDDRPVVTVAFTDDITQDDYDVSTATVSLRFRKKGTTTLLDTIVCSNGPADNEVQFDFTGGELDGLDPGHYEGELVIVDGGETHTIYETLNFRIRQNFT